MSKKLTTEEFIEKTKKNIMEHTKMKYTIQKN